MITYSLIKIWEYHSNFYETTYAVILPNQHTYPDQEIHGKIFAYNEDTQENAFDFVSRTIPRSEHIEEIPGWYVVSVYNKTKNRRAVWIDESLWEFDQERYDKVHIYPVAIDVIIP
jgi:hypothetical protein